MNHFSFRHTLFLKFTIFTLLLLFNGANGQTTPVAFRLDGVSDFWFINQTFEILNLFQKYNFPLTVGIRGGVFGEDINLVGTLRGIAGANDNWEVEFALNGWNTENLSNPNLGWNARAQYVYPGKSLIENLLDLQPTITYIQSWQGMVINQTLDTVFGAGFTRYSSLVQYEAETINQYGIAASYYNPLLLRFPAGSSTSYLTSPASSSLTMFNMLAQADRGFAVVQMQPQDFVYSNSLNTNLDKLAQLEWILQYVLNPTNGLTPVPVGNLVAPTPIPILTEQVHYPHGNCNCIAFRLDEIQDYYLTNVQQALISLFQQTNTSLTVDIIASLFGQDSSNVNFIQQRLGTPSPCFEIALGGYSEEFLSGMDANTQADNLFMGKTILRDVLQVTPITLVPYSGQFNQDTISAMEQNGFTQLSSYETLDPPPYLSTDTRVHHIPQGASTNNPYVSTYFQPVSAANTWNNIQAQLTRDGFSVVMLHVYEFTNIEFSNGQYYYTNTINQSMINELTTLINMAKKAGLNIVTLGQIQNYIWNPLDPSTPPSCLQFVPYSPTTGSPVDSIDLTSLKGPKFSLKTVLIVFLTIVGCCFYVMAVGVIALRAKPRDYELTPSYVVVPQAPQPQTKRASIRNNKEPPKDPKIQNA
jgi:hypothetical protein